MCPDPSSRTIWVKNQPFWGRRCSKFYLFQEPGLLKFALIQAGGALQSTGRAAGEPYQSQFNHQSLLVVKWQPRKEAASYYCSIQGE